MSSTLPSHLNDLGDQLDAAWGRHYGPAAARAQRKRLRTARFAIVGAAAVAALVVVLARASGPGAVEQALAAAGTYPGGSIVHFTSVTRDVSGQLTGKTELWGATSAPFARRSIIQGPDGPAIEQGARGDEVTQYDPAGVVYVRTRVGGTAEGTHAADFAAGAERVKTWLREGNARDTGEVTSGGRTVHRFVVSPAGGGSCVYDVQPETFYGLSLTCTGGRDGAIAESWAYLARDGNERLLSVEAQHPSATVDRAPMGECGKERHTPSTPPCVVTSPGA